MQNNGKTSLDQGSSELKSNYINSFIKLPHNILLNHSHNKYT